MLPSYTETSRNYESNDKSNRWFRLEQWQIKQKTFSFPLIDRQPL